MRATGLSILLISFSFSAFAQSGPETAPESEPGPSSTHAPAQLDPFSILGTYDHFEDIAGSAYVIDDEQLSQFDYDDIMRVLRAVPGIYVQDEEGFGLRPNIGIRGSGLDRSSRIALLEDGVLIAPAPYSAPSAYYFPTQRRMKSIEVLKGPAAISVGPRTTGGAINLRSTDIPDELTVIASPFAGTDNYRELYGYAGGSTERTGWLLETVQQDSDGFKSLPGGGDTGYEIRDYLAKFRINSAASAELYQSLELKLGVTDQTANETYLGLTDDDFANDPFQRYAGSQLDQFKSDHRQQQLTWTAAPVAADWGLSASLYNNDFDRNWFKLEQVNGTGISSVLADPSSFMQELDWLRGGDSPDDALTLRNNNRSYYSRGAKFTGSNTFWLGGTRWTATLGAGHHRDQEDRFQDQDLYRMASGRLELTTDNAPGSQANRVSDARVSSIWFDNEIQAGNWILQPGVRFEHIELERRDYDTADPTRAMGPTQVRRNEADVIIPGFGATYVLNADWRLLGGVYRGYNPPAPGSTADEEDSTNFEAGTRFRRGAASVDAIYFYNDYHNLVGTVTASTGGGGTIGDQFDGGKATVSGLELSSGYTFYNVGNSGWSVPVNLTWTYTDKFEFDTSFDSGYGPWGDVMAGDEMPYIPENQGLINVGLVGESLALYLNAGYQGETRTIAGSGAIPAGQGTDARWVLDLSADYALSRSVNVFARIENLLDEEYIAARRPAGARPGKDRSAVFGLRVAL